MMLTGKLAPIFLVLAFAVLPVMADADPAADKAAATIEKGLIYLKTQQKPDNSWERAGDPPAVSALVLKAFMQNSKYDADQPFLEKGFTKLLSYQKADGGIYRDLLANYNTAIAISALAVSKEAEYQPQMQKAVAFLKRLQWTDKAETVAERQQVAATDPRFGGFGYGKRERPDGSNLQIAMDALHDACVLPSDPAYAAAVTFASRLQNYKETNDQAWAGTDGGFIYTDADGGNSPAGEYTTADGKPMFRSYGSMTYAGLKTMVYAGLSKDDPRVKAAMGWIQNNWTWDENPGIKLGDGNVSESGLFYYLPHGGTDAACLRATSGD